MSHAPTQEDTGRRQAIEAWFAARHPEATGLALSGLATPGQGYSNETWCADLAWRRDGRPERMALVLRLQNSVAGVFPDNDIALQYCCMERMDGTAVPLPCLLGFETDPGWLGVPFFVMERVAGRVPNENPLYHAEGWLRELPEAERAAHWYQGIDTLAAVARVDVGGGAFSFLERPELGATPLDQQLEYFRRHMLWAERLNRPYPHLRRAWTWLDVHRPSRQPVALCWGDAKLGNCVFRDGRVVAALDWEGAHLGSPVMDLAWWLTHDRCLSEGYGVPRLSGLPERTASIAHWEAQTGRTATDFDYYEVFSAFKLASIMARIGTIFRQRGLVPADYPMDTNNGAAAVLATLGARHGFAEAK